MIIFAIILTLLAFLGMVAIAYSIGYDAGKIAARKDTRSNVVKIFNSWIDAMKEAGVTEKQQMKINEKLERDTINQLHDAIIEKYGTKTDDHPTTEEKA